MLEAYLGIPLLVLMAVFFWRRRRSRSTWLLLICLVVPATAMLGEKLIVRGRLTEIPMPWALLGRLPVLEHAIAVRFALFVILTAAIIVALWLVPGGLGRWLLVALVVISFLPDLGNRAWQTPISDPAFFSTDRYRAYLEPEDHVLTIPVWGPNERWQADDEVRFQALGRLSG